MKAVFDAGVVFSGAGWRGEAYLYLVAVARPRVVAYATEETLAEFRRGAGEIVFKTMHSPHAILHWH